MYKLFDYASQYSGGNSKFTCKASSYHFKYYSKLYKSFNKIVAVATVTKCLKQTKQKPALYVLFTFYIKNLTYVVSSISVSYHLREILLFFVFNYVLEYLCIIMHTCSGLIHVMVAETSKKPMSLFSMFILLLNKCTH